MTIYYFPTDTTGREVEARKITLLSDGKADISELPPDMQDHVSTFGVLDESRTVNLFPEDGEAFLEALLATRNSNWHFRQTPDVFSL